MKTDNTFFDSAFDKREQLPRKFTVNFESLRTDSGFRTRVIVDGVQAGDAINDNTRVSDGYRFHDVFHYTFATMLGWSPCMRALIKRKRKSNPDVDEFEDGARAAITEESISLLIFDKAKRTNFFQSDNKINGRLLNQIKEMTSSFEVSVRTKKDWENAILKGYSLFRDLIKNNGGKVHFDMFQKSAVYEN